MTGRDKDLNSLLKLALDKSVEGRHSLTASLADLFDNGGAVLSERERALMSDILRKLIRDCEMAVRRDLAERLSQVEDPPHDLIVTLANDQFEVAQPILINSAVLHDLELVQIVRRRTHEHQLAIAMRRALSEPVSDALVETGDVNVIKTLLENQDARISEATMAYLAEQSQRVDTYQEPLIKRHDLNPELARRMYLWVSAALRAHIVENFDISVTALDDKLDGVAHTMAGDPVEHAPDRESARPAAVLAKHLGETDQITWDLFIQVLREGEIGLFEALFGEMSGLRPERVKRVLYESGGESLAIACRALGMPKTSFATTFLLIRRGEIGQRMTDPHIMADMLRTYDRIAPRNAQEVMNTWRRDEDYQGAIEQVADTLPAEQES